MTNSRYPEDLIIAVRWLLHKGVEKSPEIARRLEVSPGTVRNIKVILRKRGEFPKPGEKRRGKELRKRKKKKVKSKEPIDILKELLGEE